MKLIFLLYFHLLSASINDYSKFIGHYIDPFARSLFLYKDSTFKYTSQLSGSTTCKIGSWSVSNNKISLKISSDCDTMKYDTISIPTKFYYLKGKLYEVWNGKVIKERNVSVPPGKNIDAGYSKK